MSDPKRRFTAAVLAVGATLLLLPAAGNAAEIFGSRLKGTPEELTPNTGSCTQTPTVAAPCTIVSLLTPSEPNGDLISSGAPRDGVITAFRIRAAAAAPTQVTFRVANINLQDPSNKDLALATVAGTGPTVTIPVTPAENVPIREFPGRLSVKEGQHLAIDATDALAVYDSSGDKFSYMFAPTLVEGKGAQPSNEVTGELLVQATLEPDADGDGFGDETQDRCPTQKTTQGPCDLTKPRVSRLRVSRGRVSYRLSETATVRFSLALKKHGHLRRVGREFAGKGKAGADRTAIPGGRRLAPGSYRLTMTATDVAANKTVVRVLFTVREKK